MTRKLVSLLLAVIMLLAVAASAEGVVELPRNETLYFAGQQWGTVNSWNPIGTNQNNSMAIAGNAAGYRTLMFEPLYILTSSAKWRLVSLTACRAETSA